MIELEGGKRFLWQWEKNKRIVMDEYPAGTRVEFSRRYDAKDSSIVVLSYADGGHVYANIPNILLQEACYISAFVCPSAAELTYKPQKTDFKVVRREKPDDYIYEETETLSFEELLRQIKDLEEKIKNGDNNPGVVFSDEPPEDTDVLWIDTNDEEEDLKSGVNSVNGVTPDKNGNVEIDALPDDAEQIVMLVDADLLPAVHDANGAILTDENGNIVLRY